MLLSLSMTNTFSAFTAAITNSANTAASGTLVLTEVGGANTCNSNDATPGTNNISINAATCATINKYGGSVVMVPSASNTSPTNTVVTNLTFKNSGTAAASTFTLTPGACTQGNNGTLNGTDAAFCSKLIVSISVGGTVVVNKLSATALTAGGAINLSAVPTGTAVPVIVTVFLDATSTNADQGLSASQPLVWTLSS